MTKNVENRDFETLGITFEQVGSYPQKRCQVQSCS